MSLFRQVAPLLFKNRITELTYFVTNKCNFRCKHCFMTDRQDETFNELTADEIVKMGEFIPSMQRVHLGGGEPFLRKDISDIAVAVANKWNTAVICIPTNGWFEDAIAATVKTFGGNSSKQLRLHYSINALGAGMDEFTGANGSFERLQSSILATKKLTDLYKNITLTALSTFNDYNQDDFRELIEFAVTIIGVDDVSIQLARSHKGYHPELKIKEFEKILNSEFEGMTHHPPILKTYRRLVREATADYERNPRMIVPCLAGRTRAVMSPDGNIYPCEYLGYPNGPKPEEWLLGNIREYGYDINKLLKSSSAGTIIKRIRDNKCHCSHGIDLSMNLLCTYRFKLKVIFKTLGNLLTGRMKT